MPVKTPRSIILARAAQQSADRVDQVPSSTSCSLSSTLRRGGSAWLRVNLAARALWLAMALLLWAGSGSQGRAAAAAVPEYEEYQVKAAFLYNFAKFVDWPEVAFPDPGAPIVIGILGEDPFGGFLEQIVKARLINGRKTVIKDFKNLQALESCHILFISPKERKTLPLILKALEGKSTLTVGESELFIQSGGIINFVNRDDKVGFEINEEAAERANLKISSKLLKLAKLIKDVRHP